MEDCAYSTQRQALNAVAFFFKQVCGVEDPVFGVKLRKTGTRVPVVLAKEEVRELFRRLELAGDGRYELPARLQYGAGLRRSELVRLRVKDVDLKRGTLTVRQGKGDKDYPLLRRRSEASRCAPPHTFQVRRKGALEVHDSASEEFGEAGGGAAGDGAQDLAGGS